MTPTPEEVAGRLEALLALRERAELATTQPFQPARACSWSIAEHFDGDEDLVANSMSFNVAAFFSEASNALSLYRQAASLIRSLEADRRSLAERVEKLEGALADVLPYAERGAYLSEKCAFEYGDGYTQPYELTISWEWQQSKPYTGGWVSLRSDTEAWVSELRESEADVAVVRARSALERP